MKYVALKSVTTMAVAGALLGLASPASADLLALYDGPAINKSSPACGTFGDMVSCSAPFLNYLSGNNQGLTTTNGGYVVTTPQGALDKYIVVQAGGAAALDNSDTTATNGQVENGFKTNRAGDNFLATGKANGTTVTLGNMADPGNNTLVAGADNPGTWDVNTTWLRNALTINGQRHELMIGFDYNQEQSALTSLDYWGLITVRDVDGSQKDINFEITRFTGQSYSQFTSGKSFASQPASTDFSTVSGTICIYQNTTFTNPAGKCPTATSSTGPLVQEIDNSQATNSTEFLAFMPELNDNLESYIGQGYDTISVRLLFGCFGGTDRKNGQGYLSDSGQTTNCDGGGFGDVYLMAGAVMDNRVPEPSSVALVAIGLMAAGLRRRRTA